MKRRNVLESQAVLVASKKSLIQRQGVLDTIHEILERFEAHLRAAGQFSAVSVATVFCTRNVLAELFNMKPAEHQVGKCHHKDERVLHMKGSKQLCITSRQFILYCLRLSDCGC
ncbi:hypothetical protein POM88_014022 [Heracleum sosnowskyi]|uniref:Uncharacterized protein n=1 Tax=Heracleum sosnowskyi TaxID=360622 RepID=A0AAD8N3W1_9APIA|nr:hypothetical protein POM88_014022 [Heracleum sosnowskyi]